MRVVVVPVGLALALAAGALPAAATPALSAPIPPPSPASDAGVPQTLAHSVPAGPGAVDPDFPIDYAAVTWTGEHGPASVRFRHGRTWTPWQAMPEDAIEETGRFASALVPGSDADAFQVRVPAGVRDAQAVAINTTDGETSPSAAAATAATAKTTAAATTSGSVVSRAAWGANEMLRFDKQGNEKWPRRYFPPQKLTVHHTAGLNDDPDPAATVRAIYRFHTIDRGWGDIGYQFLIDQRGTVYEGRLSDTSAATPAGFDPHGDAVVGAHVADHNSGNVGISLLGTFDDRRPTVHAQRSLERLLASLSVRTGISPTGWSSYINPSGGASWWGPNILGHRHLGQTSCPGLITYALLPTLRERVAARVAGTLVADIRMAPPRQIVVTTGAGRARIKWRTANDPSDTQLRYWPRGKKSKAVLTRLAYRFTEDHQVLLTGLARGTYEYQMIDADKAGNRYVSGVNRFSVR